MNINRSLNKLGFAIAFSACVAGCAEGWDDPMTEQEFEEGLQQKEQAVRSGTATPPPATWAKPEVGQLTVGCTATLIHRQFILSAAHCLPYPFMPDGTTVTFRDTSGVVLDTEELRDVWFHTIEQLEADPFHVGLAMNTDVAVARLANPVPTTVPRARLAQVLPDYGQTVNTYGFGGFGTTTCGPADGNKRMLSWTFAAVPSPGGFCPGDSGGPTFHGTKIFGATSTASTLGSVLRFSEEIYEKMRYAGGLPWLVGSRRDGLLLSSHSSITTDTACEALCTASTSCKAWERNTSNTCRLLSTVGAWYASDTYNSGLRPMVEVNKSRVGTLLSTTSSISALHCAGKCGANSSCAAYTYRPTLDSSCALYSTVATASDFAGRSAGVKMTADVGVQRFQGDYSTAAASSSGACATSCASDWECVGYEYSGGTCFRKNAFAPQSAAAGKTSNIKHPMPLSGIELVGTPIAGWDHVLVTPPIAEVCRAECDTLSTCVAYTADHPLVGLGMRCTLYSAVTEERGRGFHGVPLATSGYKGLTYF
jgi:hypothetical protein